MSNVLWALIICGAVGAVGWAIALLRERGLLRRSRGTIGAAIALGMVAATILLAAMKSRVVPLDALTFSCLLVGLLVSIIQMYRGFRALAAISVDGRA